MPYLDWSREPLELRTGAHPELENQLFLTLSAAQLQQLREKLLEIAVTDTVGQVAYI